MKRVSLTLVFVIAISIAAFAGDQLFSNKISTSRTGSTGGTIYPSGSGVFLDFVPTEGDTTSWLWNPNTGRYDLLDSSNNRTTTSVEFDGDEYTKYDDGTEVDDGTIEDE